MMKQKKDTQPAATQAPIFMNEEDGKWYFREKYLNDNHEIVYRGTPGRVRSDGRCLAKQRQCLK